MKRVIFFAFGVACHALFLVVFLYLAAFVGGLPVPKTIDSGVSSLPVAAAVGIDLALLALFAVPHSIMARPAFKKWWTQFVPQPIERSVYVLFACLCLVALIVFWQPIGPTIWHIENAVGRGILWGVFACGWLMVPLVSLMINHFDLFGTRQVWLHLKNRPYEYLKFRTPMAYSIVRHPLYVGWMIAFWATPTMTAGHLLFAAFLSAYMLIAIGYEERDLIDVYGDTYKRYQNEVPSLVPSLRRRRSKESPATITVTVVEHSAGEFASHA